MSQMRKLKTVEIRNLPKAVMLGSVILRVCCGQVGVVVRIRWRQVLEGEGGRTVG